MKVVWKGASGALCREVGLETGQGDVLEQGCEYEVSDELGASLVASHADWVAVEAPAEAPKKKAGGE